MSRSNLKLFRICILFFGLLIIALAGVLVYDRWPDIWQLEYAVVSVGLVYLAFFFPTVLSFRSKDSSGGIFVAGALYYKGAIGFLIASVGLVSTLFRVPIKLQYAILYHLFIIFVFVIYIYFACATDSHIARVNRMEKAKRSGVDELRAKAERLNIKSGNLPNGYEDIKTKIQKISDDMRYLSPSNNAEAIRLEDELISKINGLSLNPIFAGSENIEHDTVQNEIAEIELLIRERKAIY